MYIQTVADVSIIILLKMFLAKFKGLRLRAKTYIVVTRVHILNLVTCIDLFLHLLHYSEHLNWIDFA